MKKVCYSVLFLILINEVFATNRDCRYAKIESCNECIRCGGYWCNDPKETSRCTETRYDNWCNLNQESLPRIPNADEPGKYFNYKYRAKTVNYNTNMFEISYPFKTDEPKVALVVNSTQNSKVFVESRTECAEGKCTTAIVSEPGNNFCAKDSTAYEYYSINVTVEGINEEVILKNHVPCACQCSGIVVQKSEMCNGRGNYSCGSCLCEDGWTGKSCELCDSVYDARMNYKCKGRGTYRCGKCVCDGHWSGEFCDTCKTRGDILCNSNRNDHECSGHGSCECGCVCYNNTIGSRYFDQKNYCEDLCMTISGDCDMCVFDSRPGKCDDCKFPLYRQPYDDSLMDERDELNRHIWVRCNETFNDCTAQYAAMKNEADEIYIMIITSCDPATGAITGAVNVTLPIVLGLLAAIATAVAVAGYIFWKNRTPPLPLTDPMYQNIDAEDCTGENPLYKPPTSSFKNPTYGKW